MCPDCGAVQQEVLQVGIVGKGVVHPFPEAPFTPPEEPFVHRVPLAVLCRDRPPLGARPGDPQNACHKAAAILLAPNVYVRGGMQELKDTLPLMGGQ